MNERSGADPPCAVPPIFIYDDVGIVERPPYGSGSQTRVHNYTNEMNLHFSWENREIK